MKLLLWLLGILLTLFLAIYTLAFTSFGNALVRPYIENAIQANTNLPAKLNTFKLSMSEVEILLALTEQNTLTIKGNYSLFTQAFALTYDVSLGNLATLEPVTKTALYGSFTTDGSVKGDLKKIEIQGKSDVASSQTSYAATLLDLQVSSVIASIKDAKVEELLAMVAQPNFATAKLNLDVAFSSLDPQNLLGDASVTLSNGVINTKVIKEHYAVTLPQTTFTSKTIVKLQGKDVIYKTELASNLANITSKGTIQPQNLGMNLTYALNIAELALLKPITNAPLRGNFNLKGNVVGDKASLVVKGESDIAASKTNFQATLKEFAPESVTATVANLQLAKLLYMVEQPHYTDGEFSMKVAISDARMESLKGTIETTITKGELDAPYITKLAAFASPMPKSTFSATTYTTLNKELIDTKAEFRSNLANLFVKKATFNLKDSSLHSDYTTTIPNLDALFFATRRHLKGSLSANGAVHKAKDLDFTLFSEVAGGKIEAKLHNDDFHADIIAIQTLDALKMLIYPELFKATLNAQLDYNLALQKGLFKGKLLEGVFTKNQIFDLIKQYAQTDMYKEFFSGDVHAMINQEKITASLDLRSNTSSIITKDAKLNSKTQQIGADIDLVFNKNPVSASVKGDMNAPKVSIDLQKFMQSKAGQKVQEKATKLFKKLF